jgi:hypothetical protein
MPDTVLETLVEATLTASPVCTMMATACDCAIATVWPPPQSLSALLSCVHDLIVHERSQSAPLQLQLSIAAQCACSQALALAPQHCASALAQALAAACRRAAREP